MTDSQSTRRTERRRKQLNKTMDTLFPQESPDRCRVCAEPVVDGRWNYCSVRCRRVARAVQKMYTWESVREQVAERDGWSCAGCGVTRERWERAYWQVQEIAKQRAEPLRDDVDAWRERLHEVRGQYDVEYPEFHVDHIKRIEDGGHPFDESNLQTLCKHCHHDKTARENRDESIQQRPELGLEVYLGGVSDD